MIVLEHDSANVLRVTGDSDSLMRFHNVYQTEIWPSWRTYLGTGRYKQLDAEQQYLEKTVPLGYILLSDIRETHSGINAAIADAQTIMTVIQ